MPASERGEAVAHAAARSTRRRSRAVQAQDAGAHDVRPPDQQRDGGEQIEQVHAPVLQRSASPGQRVRLDVGEALHRLLHAFLVAQARILDAAERRQLEPVAGHFADVDRADMQLGDETRDVVEAVGADRGRQTVRRAD